MVQLRVSGIYSCLAVQLQVNAELTNQIAYSSITPLSGRLCQIFTPRVYVFFTSSLLALGLFVTAAAPNLSVFLVGRAIAGCGAGGQSVTALVLALDLTSKKRRGLFLGLISAAMTTGIASGAVLSGLLTTVYGWVGMRSWRSGSCY